MRMNPINLKKIDCHCYTYYLIKAVKTFIIVNSLFDLSEP